MSDVSTAKRLSLPLALERANAEIEAGNLDAAASLLASELAAESPHPHAVHLSGILAWRRGKLAEAAALMERSITLGPEIALYPRNICEVYRALGRYDAALESARRTVAMAPHDPVARANLGVVHYDRGETIEALAAAEKAIALAPNMAMAHLGRAEALLLRGDFAPGLEEYEWRLRVPGGRREMPPEETPAWNGDPPHSGTLLLIADQGIGDVIQFSRYIPWAATRARKLVVASGPERRPIIAQFPEVAEIRPRWQDFSDFAAWCPLASLPRLAATRLESIPAPVPYLRADPSRIERWDRRLAQLAPPGMRRIGLVWAGRPEHTNDRKRSLPLAALAPLAALDGMGFLSLQKGEAATQLGGYFGRAPLINLGPEIADFDDTMAILECLERTVTVDTAVAHLAGAMARPAMLLLPHAPDWRWLRDRNDSPWYPTLSLFRQPTPGEWGRAIAQVAAALAATSPPSAQSE